MSDETPQEWARDIVEACSFSRSVKPITWADDLYENVLLAIREAESRGLKMAENICANYPVAPHHGKILAAEIRKLIPAEPGSTA